MAQIKRFDGRTATLRTRDIARLRIEMSRRQRFLGTIAHPQIAYLLLTLGMLGLTVELWNPGGILPGVVGGLCLLLAFFAFQILPVNTIGAAADCVRDGAADPRVKIPSFGVLGIGGTSSLMIGAVMLTGDIPGCASTPLVVPAALALAIPFPRSAGPRAAQPRSTGVGGARRAAALRSRRVRRWRRAGPVRGEIWRARAKSPLETGGPVRVTALTGSR